MQLEKKFRKKGGLPVAHLDHPGLFQSRDAIMNQIKEIAAISLKELMHEHTMEEIVDVLVILI